MPKYQLDDNWREQAQTVRRHHLRAYQIFGAAAFCVLMILVAYHFTAQDRQDDFKINLLTEMLGVLVTTLAIGAINIWWSERQQLQELIIDLGGSSHEFAKRAARILEVKGWLYDGSLKEVNLSRATLQGADLERANLQGATLVAAHLERSYLWKANLQTAFLAHAELQGALLAEADLRAAHLEQANLQNANLRSACLLSANLFYADLRGADLIHANLRGANLCIADFRGADLINANLQGVILLDPTFGETNFNESTTLPNGRKWTPNTDMARFTDPNHPDFWQPDWVKDE